MKTATMSEDEFRDFLNGNRDEVLTNVTVELPILHIANVSRSFFKAFIRVVKSIAFKDPNEYMGFDTVEVIREPLIEAKDKAEVKAILLEKYPQFFQNGKVYEKETKNDKAQFFYVVIFVVLSFRLPLAAY
jgi:hypothetical protein